MPRPSVLSSPLEYHVFLSHNRKNKQWVRDLYAVLRSCGLEVFFDEESIPPGANIISALEDAVARSRRVLLVISTASMASRWVAMEIQHTLHADPDARETRLLPIIIEPVDIDQLRPTLRTINCIDLTDPATRDARLRRVLQACGADPTGAALPPWPEASGIGRPSRPAVGTIDNVIEWGWDGTKLLEEFIALDYATLANLRDSHEGTPAQWAPVFMEHPQTWRMLYVEPRRLVGYWHFAPLFADDFQRALSGELLDSSITADRVQTFEFPGRYCAYFVQVCLLPQFRVPAFIRPLFESILDVLLVLARDGVFIDEFCANAYTESGRGLCRTLRMIPHSRHCEHGEIFRTTTATLLGLPFASSFHQLRELYQREGLRP